MKRKKFLSLLLALTLLSALLAGCGSSTATTAGEATAEPTAEPAAAPTPEPTPEPVDDVEIRIGALTGPTAMGLAKLLTDSDKGEAAGSYSYLLAGSADELTPKLLQGELDVAAVPVNLASVLYNKTEGGMLLGCVNTLGVLYIVEKGGEEVQSLRDLAGRTIYATGKGSTPEYTLRYLLAAAGVDPDEDVDIQFKSEPAEVVALMSTEEHSLAMLPQPYVTVALGSLESARTALSLNEAWEALDNGCLLVTAGLVVRKTFAEEHPAALSAFLDEYAASVAWVNENVAEAAECCETLGIVKAAVAQKAIPACNITFIAGAELRQTLPGFLEILFEQNPAAVGGALPGDDFYYDAA